MTNLEQADTEVSPDSASPRHVNEEFANLDLTSSVATPLAQQFARRNWLCVAVSLYRHQCHQSSIASKYVVEDTRRSRLLRFSGERREALGNLGRFVTTQEHFYRDVYSGCMSAYPLHLRSPAPDLSVCVAVVLAAGLRVCLVALSDMYNSNS